MTVLNAYKAQARKRAELVDALFLCDRYLSELKLWIGCPEENFKKDTFLHLSTVAMKLDQVTGILDKYYAQFSRIVPAPDAPPLRGTQNPRNKILDSYDNRTEQELEQAIILDSFAEVEKILIRARR
jgi:hypothetical protein